MFWLIVILEDPFITHLQCFWLRKEGSHRRFKGRFLLKLFCKLSRKTDPKHIVSISMPFWSYLTLPANMAGGGDAEELDFGLI